MIGQHDGAPACPNCQVMNDGYASVGNDEKPSDGDYSVCFYCRTLAIYTINPITGLVSLRRPSDEELVEAIRDPSVRNALLLLG